jgi:translation elongation factor EF-Ts
MSLEIELAVLTEASKNLAGTVSAVAVRVNTDHDDFVTYKERFNTLENKVKEIIQQHATEQTNKSQRRLDAVKEKRSTSLQINLAAVGIIVSIALALLALFWK